MPATMPAKDPWVRTYENGADYIESLSGVSWADAPLPARVHMCYPQTRGWLGLNRTERCACGATRFNGSGWLERNQTRKSRRKQRREDTKPRVHVTCGTCGNAYEAAEGSHQAREELCNSCWANRLIGRQR